MKINVRNIGVAVQYKEVTLEVDNTTICLGLLDRYEAADLAEKLMQAASELCPDANISWEFNI